jgi:hypothetical protein
MMPMRTIPGPGSSARGGTTTDFPLCLQARSRGIPRYNLRVGKLLPAGSPDPNGWHRVPTQLPACSWGTGIAVNRPLSRDPCPPHGGVRGHLVHEEWGGEPGDNPVPAALTRVCLPRGERPGSPFQGSSAGRTLLSQHATSILVAADIPSFDAFLDLLRVG